MRPAICACLLLLACAPRAPKEPTSAPASSPSVPAPLSAEERSEKLSYYLAQGAEAYQSKDFARLIESYREAVALSPHNPGLKYVLARGYALGGQPEEALSILAQLTEMGLAYRLSHPDLASLKEDPSLAPISARMEQNKTPLLRSGEAFTFPEKDLLIEGIAYDPETRSFFVSSVHRRTVLRVGEDGDIARFLPEPSPELWGALGIAVDAKRRALWVCSAALPEAEGVPPEEAGRSAVLRYHLDTGALEERYLLPAGGKHALGDLTLSAAGDVFVSDGLSGALYTIPRDGDALTILVPAGALRSPQGLALSGDEATLFIVDYTGGLFALDRRSNALRELGAPASLALYGMDGLLWYKGGLIAIQNGVPPARVVRLSLDAGASAVTRAEILERGMLEEPTLGVIVDDALYFIAVSQWASFADGALRTSGELPKAQVRRLPLE